MEHFFKLLVHLLVLPLVLLFVLPLLVVLHMFILMAVIRFSDF
jgi:hypothetical protein